MMTDPNLEQRHFEPVQGNITVKPGAVIMKHRGAVGDAGIHLELRTNLFLGSREMGDRILRFLAQTGDIFVPELFDGGKLTSGSKVRFDPENLTLPLDVWVDERHSLGIIAERNNPVPVCIDFGDRCSSCFRPLRIVRKNPQPSAPAAMGIPGNSLPEA